MIQTQSDGAIMEAAGARLLRPFPATNSTRLHGPVATGEAQTCECDGPTVCLCRAYMSVKELKEELHLSGADTLNVFFASNSAREELAGAATWPWAKEALTHQGE